MTISYKYKLSTDIKQILCDVCPRVSDQNWIGEKQCEEDYAEVY
jgi:hypothetical protein